jgi:hypothetical protein
MFEVREIKNKLEWNTYLGMCVNQNIFSTWQWGEFKSSTRDIERLAFFKKGTFVGMTQLTFKNISFLKLGWGSSGINLTNYKYLDKVIDSIQDFYNFNKTVIRFNFFDEKKGEINFAFDEIKALAEVPVTINSGYTVWHGSEELMGNPKKYDSNTRYYLKKAEANELSFDVCELDIGKFEKIHHEMAQLKNKLELSVNKTELLNIQKVFGDDAKMGIVSQDGKTVSACLILFVENYAYYFLAGSTKQGREQFSSFFMIHQLIKYFNEKKIQKFDFGGISPFLQSVRGINRFKMGFGGKVINYIGERNLTHSRILNFIFNLYIKLKVSNRG